MSSFNNLNLVNFFSKADLSNEQIVSKAKDILYDRESIKYLLENINLFTNITASEIFSLSPYTSDKEIAYLAISKDTDSLKHLAKHLYSNRNFMKSITNISKGHGIYYIDNAIADDEELIENYIYEIFMSEDFHNFPEVLTKSKKLNKTYFKVLDTISLDASVKKAMVEYYIHKETQFYNAAKAFGKKTISEEQELFLKKLSDKISFMSKNAMMCALLDDEQLNN